MNEPVGELVASLPADAAFVNALVACAIAATTCWLLSVATLEYSWVDRLWSILPPMYVSYFAYAAGWHPRLVLMTALVALWGARLTYNFARKGGYRKGGEDYRWAELRKRMGPVQFQAFNVAFIAGYQNLLLLLISLPAWAAIDGGASRSPRCGGHRRLSRDARA